jgi:hypothetical protein
MKMNLFEKNYRVESETGSSVNTIAIGSFYEAKQLTEMFCC